MDSTALISIVIVTHGRPEFVLKCLESCEMQDYPERETVLVINPVDDETETAVRAKFPETKIIRTHKNLGAFPAKNIGIANSNGSMIMLLDDDAYFQSETDLSNLHRALVIEPALAAVTCNIEGPYEEAPLKEDRYVWYFKDGFTLFHRKVYTDWVGYYPDLFFRAGGEPFLALTLWDQKRPIKQLSTVSIFHALTKKGRSPWHFQYYSVRHHVLLAILRDPIRVLPLTLASKLVSGFRHYVIRGHSPAAFFLGWMGAVMQLPWAIRNRKPIRYSTWKMVQGLKKSGGSKKSPI